MKSMMIAQYVARSAADIYAVGIVRDGEVRVSFFDHLPEEYIALDTASRGQGKSLRVRIPAKAQRVLFADGMPLCSADELIDNVGHINAKGERKHWNKGEMLERNLALHYGLAWKKDTEKFSEKGDIEVNGIAIQVKLYNATLTNCKTLENIIAQ